MAYRAEDPAPLLPASVKAWLQGWLLRALGCAVLVTCAATAASLLTWTAIDPILARATGSAARNLMGAPGAILADVIMQMTGLAGMFALLPPLFWAFHLVTSGRPPGALRFKLALAPLAVLAMAVALSSLPVLNGSPLHHGYGGLIGDTGLVLVAGLLAKVNPDRSWAAAGLFCFAGGTIALVRSVGLTQADLKAMCRTAPRVRVPSSWSRPTPVPVPQAARREPLLSMPPQHTAWPARHEPSFDPLPPARVEEVPVEEAPMPYPRAAAPRRPEPEPDYPRSGRGQAFDHYTDRSSEDIARRFAPSGAAGAGIDEPRATLVACAPSADAPAASADYPVSIDCPTPVASPAVRHADATWVRSSLGPLKRQPVRGIARATPQAPHGARPHVCDLLESDAFRGSDATLPLALGQDAAGQPVIADLARMPSLLLAAAQHAEKASGIDAVILSLIYRHAPDRCRLMLIAGGRSSLSLYEGLPHLLAPVTTDPGDGLAALAWIAGEMDDRHRHMAALGVGNIDVFNNRAGKARNHDGRAPLPHIVVVVDDLADLMRFDRERVESLMQRLDRKARAAGIHLVLATQRPAADVVTAAIRKACPTRLAFSLASAADSASVLEAAGAEQLSGDGDLLCGSSGDRLVRALTPAVSRDDVNAIVACLRDQAQARYV